MEFVRLSKENFDRTVKQAAGVLAKGGIVIYPTDTIYGMAVDALNRPALEHLREVKGREKKKPISIVVPDVESIEAYAETDTSSRFYAKHYLPGALTLVMRGKPVVPPELMLNGDVGIRIPNDEFTLALARAYKHPFTATSANRAGLPTFSNPHDIIRQFGALAHELDLIVDDGPREGKGSTVLTFKGGDPFVLREGTLSKKDLGL